MEDITVRLRRGFGGMVPPISDEAANLIDDLRTLVENLRMDLKFASESRMVLKLCEHAERINELESA